MNMYYLFSLPAGGELLILAIVIPALIFWIVSIVDIARSRFDSDTTKIVWLLIVLFLGIIGAIIYHFAGKQSRVSY